MPRNGEHLLETGNTRWFCWVPGCLAGANWIVAIFSLLLAVFLSTEGQQYCWPGQDVPQASLMQRRGDWQVDSLALSHLPHKMTAGKRDQDQDKKRVVCRKSVRKIQET